MALSKSQQEFALLELLGIAPPSEPPPRMWGDISERVYIDGDMKLLEVYSEYYQSLEDWQRAKKSPTE